ncbi:MAG: hypothetical protein M1131_00375 [Actinobacteria bacterium]|nr:hypothetical protein [Actinomycetota bacterium]MCL6095861.1 hypothetical protein [Actinomycetota bacterium]
MRSLVRGTPDGSAWLNMVDESISQVSSADGDFDLDMVLAALRADAEDTRIYFEVLSKKLDSVLGERLVVERAGGGLFRRSKEQPVRSIAAEVGDKRLEAVLDKGKVRCSVHHTVRGIVLRSDEVSFQEWLRHLVEALLAEAGNSAETRAALQALLT